MEASELRSFSVEELRGRIRQWKEELFRARFKSESSEAKDTSIFFKLRKDIARAMTVLNEKNRGIELPSKPVQVDAPKAKKASKKEAKAEEPAKSVAAEDVPAGKSRPKKGEPKSEKVKTDGK
jgi:large subunit ribosomal protein L29